MIYSRVRTPSSPADHRGLVQVTCGDSGHLEEEERRRGTTSDVCSVGKIRGGGVGGTSEVAASLQIFDGVGVWTNHPEGISNFRSLSEDSVRKSDNSFNKMTKTWGRDTDWFPLTTGRKGDPLLVTWWWWKHRMVGIRGTTNT